MASGFKKPTGLAVDTQGSVYVADEGQDEAGGSVFRIDSSRNVTLVATGFKHPQGLALTPDGQLLVAAERLQREGEAQGGTVFQVNLEDGSITPPGGRRLSAAAFVGP